ncbi:IS21 family transposase [Microbacterium sp. Sa4CUA7]|uniref:IS21 family transposase n=1 Tax=Microbacterium pullorum TaxID=2762236 RepID=A0ABR8S5W5_9MICO|nr:IS21 family transposase [Microbacterium pullorum]MBD7958852.1 IS21 family transposase [Microbacterium pullorum]
MISVEDWAEIRRLHKAEGMPIKAIVRKLGVARNTVRSALASDEPPVYRRAPRRSLVDAVEPEIRKWLREDAKMPATVIAERIGWEHSITILKDRVRQIRPEYAGVDPADRIVHHPGQAAQMDLWFPEPRIPVGFGQAAMLPVLVMTLTFSKFLAAVMLPSRQGGDLTAGMWQLIAQVGAVSKTLVWDRESAIGGKGKVTQLAAAFAGTLATRVVLAPPADPEFKGMTERNNGFFETSFLPGRRFVSPADFNGQLQDWLPRANARTIRSLGGRPVDVLDRDLAAMTALPPHPPATGLQARVRLGRDYYVRVDGNDYSVDPRVIGRLVDVTATLTRVIVVCDGSAVADHERSWATGGVVTDPAHVVIAKGLRSQYAAAKRDRARAELASPERRVMFRDPGDYDDLFGVRFDPNTGEVR